MYKKHYGLASDPFRLSPDHAFCLPHRSFAKAKAYMRYAMHRGEGFVMITGAPGTGKTTLIDELMSGIRPERYNLARLVGAQVEGDDALRLVASAYGVNSEQFEKSMLLQQLSELFTVDFRRGKRTLLIIDEAQGLGLGALEELRLLTNIRDGSQPLLQIFLVGQEELREMVTSPQLEQLNQRMIAAYHMEPLKPEEFVAYILHRLTKAGWQGRPMLQPDLFAPIFRVTNGVPRRINHICSRLLLHGFLEEKESLDSSDVDVVVKELRAEHYALEDRATMLSPESFNSEDLQRMAQTALNASAAHRKMRVQANMAATQPQAVVEPSDSQQADRSATVAEAAQEPETPATTTPGDQKIPLLTDRVGQAQAVPSAERFRPLELERSQRGRRWLALSSAAAVAVVITLLLMVSVVPMQHLEKLAGQSVWQTLGVIKVRSRVTRWSGGRLPLKQSGAVHKEPLLPESIERVKKRTQKQVASN